MKNLLFWVVIGLFVGAASDAMDDWTRTASVAPGSRVTMNTVSGEENRGTFRSAGPDSMSLTVNGRDLEIQRSEVARIHVYTGSRRLRNLLIWAGIGAAAGMLSGFATCPSCVGHPTSEDAQRRLGLGGLIGAAAGAGAGTAKVTV